NTVSQNTREQRTQRTDRNQATATLQQEVRGKIHVVSPHASTVLACREFRVPVFVANFPGQAVGARSGWAQWFKNFGKADILVAISIYDGHGVGRDRGIDGKPLL